VTGLFAWRKMPSWIKIQLFVTLGLFPLGLLFFNQIALSSFIANSVAIPYFSFIIVPLCLVGGLFLIFHIPYAGYILNLAHKLIAYFWHYLTWLASIFKLDYVYPPLLNHLAIVYGIIIIVCCYRGFPGKYLAVFLGALVLIPNKNLEKGELNFTLLDVGQGLSAIITTRHHTLIYDTGAKWSPKFDIGSAVLVPYLRHQGITKVDRLIVSHGDNDHSGGAHSLLKAIDIKKVITSVPKAFISYNAQPCSAGQSWVWDGVQFEVLWPELNHYNKDRKMGNNDSCVLRVTNGTYSILLPGDIEAKAEKKLKVKPTTILVAPHHGSKTSSTLPFIKQLAPEIVLFSTGYRNRFGFPKQEVKQRFFTYGAVTYNTAEVGAVMFFLPKQKLQHLEPKCFKYEQRHFWTL